MMREPTLFDRVQELGVDGARDEYLSPTTDTSEGAQARENASLRAALAETLALFAEAMALSRRAMALYRDRAPTPELREK